MKRTQINNPSSFHKNLENEEQNTHKIGRRKEGSTEVKKFKNEKTHWTKLVLSNNKADKPIEE